jgi:hypothetical protein
MKEQSNLYENVFIMERVLEDAKRSEDDVFSYCGYEIVRMM